MQKKNGRKATTRAARAASTKAIRAAVAREARRRGISQAELIRQSSDAHKRMSARGKLHHAPIMDAEPTTTAKEQRERSTTKRNNKAVEVKYQTHIVKAAAREAGTTPAEYVAKTHTFNVGHPMSAKLIRTEGEYSVFEIVAHKDVAMNENTNANCVTFTDDGDAVTIRVTGKAYRNLAKVAAASNKCKWTDDDGSPATVAEYWVGSLLERCENTPREDPNNGIKEVIDDIVVSIDTGFDEGSHEDEERRAQLKAAFDEIDWENGGAA